MRRVPILLLATLAVLVAGCGSDPDDVVSDTTAAPGDTTSSTAPSTETTAPTVPAGGDELAGRAFVSTQIQEGGQDRPLAGDTPIRLDFGDGTIGATGGCNSISGDYEVVDGVLEVGELAMTMMACDPPSLMSQDDWVSELLSAGPSVVLDGGTLTLTSGDRVLVLEEEAPVDDVALTGGTWELESITVGTGPEAVVSSVPQGSMATLVFGEDGRVAVQPGCNTGSGDYTVGEGTITFGPIMLTRMACEEEVMALETTVMAVLEGEVPFEIEGEVLVLTAADTALDFRAG